MATDLVRRAFTYACEEELAFGHRIPGRNKGGSRALSKEITATRGFDSHKLAGVVWFK